MDDTLFLITTGIGYDTFTNKKINMLESVKFYTFKFGSTDPNFLQDYYTFKLPRFSYLTGFDTGPIIKDYYRFENDIWQIYCFWNQYYGSYVRWQPQNTNTRCSDIKMSVAMRPEVSVKLYPNPVSSIVKIDGVEGQEKEVSVFNSMGQLMIKETYSGQLNVSQLPDGLYVLCVNHMGQYEGSFKFMKSEQ